MSVSTREPLPPEAGQFGGFEARMLRNFRATVEDWDEVCSELGAWEAKHLAREEPGEAKEQHRRWVTELLSWGRIVQHAEQEVFYKHKELKVDMRSTPYLQSHTPLTAIQEIPAMILAYADLDRRRLYIRGAKGGNDHGLPSR